MRRESLIFMLAACDDCDLKVVETLLAKGANAH